MNLIKKSIVATITGPDGILKNFNCQFIGISLDRLIDSLCVKIVPPFFRIAIGIALLAFGFFF